MYSTIEYQDIFFNSQFVDLYNNSCVVTPLPGDVTGEGWGGSGLILFLWGECIFTISLVE